MSDKPKITDSHCHLDFPDFNDDLSEVINNACLLYTSDAADEL